MEQSLLLSLDIGTSSVRAALYDCKASPIPKMFVKNERTLTVSPGGGAEIEADDAFEQVAEAIDELLAKAVRVKGEIEYVATSTFWHSLVGVDLMGKPTTNVFGWSDTRSRKYTQKLRKRFDEGEVHNRNGARFHSSFWPAKLLWLRHEFPDIFSNTARWLSLSDYIALQLFGAAETSVSMASGTGIFDIRQCIWDVELMRYLKVKPTNMPEIVGTDSKTFKLSPKVAKRWPRLKNAHWFAAIADGAADNIGSGCVTRGKAALMIGTSGAMRVAYTGEPPLVIPDGLWCYRVDRKRIIIGGALSDGGGLYRWLNDTLKLPKDAEAQISSREPASHGLIFLPFLAGERSTGYHESATGTLVGLQTSTNPVDILQAAMESVAYRFAEIFEQLNSVVKIKEIVASGGALRESTVWTQIIADVLGRNMSLPDTREASSRGAVLLALETIGKLKSIEQISNTSGNPFKCRESNYKKYSIARDEHKRMYNEVI